MIRRRVLLRALLAAACFPAAALRRAPRLVVVGGGFGGAAAAARVKRAMPAAEVTLIEKNARYAGAPFFNFVAAGEWPVERVMHGYDDLAAFGVRVISAAAAYLRDGAAVLADGAAVPYDRAIVAPGIAFDFTRMPGYAAADAQTIPHAYAGKAQALLLRRQIAQLKRGGVVIIIPPPLPYRCPPAPYERAALIAAAMQKRRLRGKVLLLDQKEGFPQQTLFDDEWSAHYRDIIEWRSRDAGGLAESLDVKRRRVQTEFGEEAAAVINYIPPQRAAAVAAASGLTDDSGWCPVTPATMESTLRPGVHVIGDAAAVAPLPKSAVAAESAGHAAADAVIAAFSDAPAPAMRRINNLCYSYTAPARAFSERGVYAADKTMMKPLSVKLTPRDADADERRAIAAAGVEWYDAAARAIFMPTR